MNEDREGEKCNIVFLEGVKVNQIICLTKRKILSGEELFVSYGNEVDRSHWDKKECQQAESGGSETATDSHQITTVVGDDNNKTWGIRATQAVVPASTEMPSAAENNGIARMLQTLTTAGTTHEDTNYLGKDL
ncbi:hypothetical protein LPJ73_003466 [Coemansia sp. RSA 2703]|nr:hypothetical protein LPJ73_003466 [Coemansia sp. RSA 2703]